MNKIKQDRNKNIKNIYDENNGNDERNINLDCPASNLGNRDVHNSPQTVVTNQEKFRPHKVAPTGIFPDWTTGCVSHCIPIERRLHSLSWAGLQVDGTADILGERNQKDKYKNN